MKQYTNEIQTAKLIELGFEKPRNERWVLDVANESTPSIQNIVKRQDYSIGELIGMLPTIIDAGTGYALSIYYNRAEWEISYDDNGLYHPLYSVENDELIDALYEMIVRLKEEEVI